MFISSSGTLSLDDVQAPIGIPSASGVAVQLPVAWPITQMANTGADRAKNKQTSQKTQENGFVYRIVDI